jgi:hypothetical protein
MFRAICSCPWTAAALLVLLSSTWADEPLKVAGERPQTEENAAEGQFVGSTPCDAAIRRLLEIPADANEELMEWKLTLQQDPKTRMPATFLLRSDYGPTSPGKPGLGKRTGTVELQGRWSIAKGTKDNPQAEVYVLNGAVNLFRVSANVLHILTPDRALMVGNGGWSYTLNRASAAEKPGDAARTIDMTYPIASASTGPVVCGIFEGRSPCQGIAHALGRPEHPGCTKAKWRVTLYQDPMTGAPTTYKVEGTLYRKGAREGKWSIEQGASGDSAAVVYRLAPTETDAAIFLLRGDDHVLFFLDQKRKPLVGHAEFSYTLNRREADELTAVERKLRK